MTTVHSKIEPSPTPDKSLFGKLKEIMEWLVARLEAGISKIMDFLKSRTKTSKPVREVMSSIINDSQSDIGYAGEKCMSLLEDLDPEEQAPALGFWKDLWRKITVGAVSLFEIICQGFAGARQGIENMFHVVWQKLKAVFTGIGQAIAGFWGKLMSVFGRHSAHMMYARNPESLGIVSLLERQATNGCIDTSVEPDAYCLVVLLMRYLSIVGGKGMFQLAHGQMLAVGEL